MSIGGPRGRRPVPVVTPETVYINGVARLVDQGEVVEIDAEAADALVLEPEEAMSFEDAFESRFDGLDLDEDNT